MRVLITGGAGYIGSVLVPMLLANEQQVTVLDNFRHGENSLASSCIHRNLTIICGDACDPGAVATLAATADAIIPLAALVGAPLCDREPVLAQAVNLDAIKTLLVELSPSQLLIFPTTNSGYGATDDLCTEDTPLAPISHYGRLKVEAEKLVMERENSISLRLATVFGMSPRMRLDLMVNDFVWRALHDRTLTLFEAQYKRNFVHVIDVARLFLWCIRSFETMRGRSYNVARENLTKLDLCNRIRDQIPDFSWHIFEFGKDVDGRNCAVSTERLEATGFRTTVSLDEGIRELIKGYQGLRDRRYGNI